MNRSGQRTDAATMRTVAPPPGAPPHEEGPAMRITVRPARPTDLEDLADLFDQYRQFYAQAPDAAKARRFIHDRLVRGDAVILVAEQADGTLAGFCQLYPGFCSILAEPVQLLSDLYVRPESRRSGAGRALMQAAEAQGAASGRARLDLTTARDNTRAQALYAAQGWQRDDAWFMYTRSLAAAD